MHCMCVYVYYLSEEDIVQLWTAVAAEILRDYAIAAGAENEELTDPHPLY